MKKLGIIQLCWLYFTVWNDPVDDGNTSHPDATHLRKPSGSSSGDATKSRKSKAFREERGPHRTVGNALQKAKDAKAFHVYIVSIDPQTETSESRFGRRCGSNHPGRDRVSENATKYGKSILHAADKRKLEQEHCKSMCYKESLFFLKKKNNKNNFTETRLLLKRIKRISDGHALLSHYRIKEKAEMPNPFRA